MWLTRFHKQSLEIDCVRLTSVQSPSASGVEEMTTITTAVAPKLSPAYSDNHNITDRLLGRGLGPQTL